MRIAMIGAGYVGLTTGACFAELGHEVCCNDIDAERLARLSGGEIPIYEKGLEELIRRNVEASRLSFCESMEVCIGKAELVFLAVGTPSNAGGEIDLSQIKAAARRIAPSLAPGAVVVVKSTVVVGTCRLIREVIAEKRKSLDFTVASNPEFLREGSAVEDFMHPDRIVIGADDKRSAALLAKLYEPLARHGAEIVSTSTANAELIKHAANAFLALKIGFINDVAELCEKAGGDVVSVAKGIGLDRRIGPAFLSPGPGFGGSCFPKDTRAFAATGRRHGAPQLLVETLIDRNEKRKASLARRILQKAGLTKGSTVCVLGLAFKADTDDIRESAALTIIPFLQKAGLSVAAHDPKAIKNAGKVLEDVRWARSPYEAARGSDAIVILTEWKEYRSLDLTRLAREMSGRTLFDYRNLLSPDAVTRSGLRYIGVGRPEMAPAAVRPRAAGTALASMDQWVAAPRHE